MTQVNSSEFYNGRPIISLKRVGALVRPVKQGFFFLYTRKKSHVARLSVFLSLNDRHCKALIIFFSLKCNYVLYQTGEKNYKIRSKYHLVFPLEILY